MGLSTTILVFVWPLTKEGTEISQLAMVLDNFIANWSP